MGMKWWGWGDERVSFSHADKPALGPFLHAQIGVEADVTHQEGTELRLVRVGERHLLVAPAPPLHAHVRPAPSCSARPARFSATAETVDERDA